MQSWWPRVKSVRQLLAEAVAQLSGEEVRAEAALLLAHALGVSKAWLVAHADDAVESARAESFHDLVMRRTRGEPVAYLVGIRGFHALELEVTSNVLIPRPETELLVDLALQRIPVDADCAVADLGTGSGAVALAIASQRPRARVLATDASLAALNVARGNTARLGLRNVAFAHGDWCAALGTARFDLIVSNPPYIADDDPRLQQGDLRFEPRAALASGADGLDAVRTIIRDARRHLREGGWLLLEHGYEQGAAARDLLARHGYRDVFTERDLENRERVSGGRSGSATTVEP
jgi:release factor glutamine methyltransferase